MIDNYDSFVFNIYQYILELTGEEVRYFRNDEITLQQVRELAPSHIILSPGPNHPKDSGVCLDILRADLDVPILGVCLGHQAIGYAAGAKIKQLDVPLHGKSSAIEIYADGVLFSGLPRKFEVMRYHSLYVDEATLPCEFEILAKSENDGVIVAV